MTTPFDEQWRVHAEDRLKSGVGEVSPTALGKIKDCFDEHHACFVAASPYVCVATCGPDGADVSPRGDDPGFVRLADPTTLVLPERTGNRIADTLTNLLANPAIGLLFLIPGCPETLRVNGHAHIQDGPPELLESMAARGRIPKLAIVVDVAQVYMHCGRAASRSRIWDPTMTWTDPRPDRLIGDFLGIDDAASADLLNTYNSSEL